MTGILTDITRCVGCEKCVNACQKENHCKPERPEHKRRPGELFDTRWTSIVQRPEQHFVRRQCRHCLHPACVSACPVGAMSRSVEGPVIYNKKRCIGCRYCMMACPYGIPRYEWDSLAPGVTKCIFCYHRVTRGKEPACTEACPEKATIFGDRKALLKEAKQRIQQNPGTYLPEVIGEHEAGGTSVLYLSDIKLDFLLFNHHMGNGPIPQISLKTLSAMPAAAGGICAVLAGIRWIIARRMRIPAPGRDKGKNT
ncbi:4Fe-4S dicluster domain-containing protein [Fibrobacterota bacterium]